MVLDREVRTPTGLDFGEGWRSGLGCFTSTSRRRSGLCGRCRPTSTMVGSRYIASDAVELGDGDIWCRALLPTSLATLHGRGERAGDNVRYAGRGPPAGNDASGGGAGGTIESSDPGGGVESLGKKGWSPPQLATLDPARKSIKELK